MKCTKSSILVALLAIVMLAVPAVTFAQTTGTLTGTVKDAQAHLRHASAKTTLEYYAQELPESTRQAVELMSEKLFPAAEKKERIN